MEILIEQATINDVEDIQLLNKKLFDYEIGNEFDDNLEPNWSFSEEGKTEIKTRILSAEISCGFVAKVDSQIVGYIIGLIQEDETGRSESRFAEMEHMFVRSSFRNNGIGELLINKFVEWAKDKGIIRFKANVSYKNTKAIEFYKKIGLNPADVTMTMTL